MPTASLLVVDDDDAEDDEFVSDDEGSSPAPVVIARPPPVAPPAPVPAKAPPAAAANRGGTRAPEPAAQVPIAPAPPAEVQTRSELLWRYIQENAATRADNDIQAVPRTPANPPPTAAEGAMLPPLSAIVARARDAVLMEIVNTWPLDDPDTAAAVSTIPLRAPREETLRTALSHCLPLATTAPSPVIRLLNRPADSDFIMLLKFVGVRRGDSESIDEGSSTVFPLTSTGAAVETFARHRYGELSYRDSCLLKMCFALPDEQDTRSDIELQQEQARSHLMRHFERLTVCVAVVFDDDQPVDSNVVEISGPRLAACVAGDFAASPATAVAVLNRVATQPNDGVTCDVTFHEAQPKFKLRVHFMQAHIAMTHRADAAPMWSPARVGGVAVHCKSREVITETQTLSVQSQIALRCTAVKAQQIRTIQDSTPVAGHQASSVLLAALSQIWWVPRKEIAQRYAEYVDADSSPGDFWDVEECDDAPTNGLWFATDVERKARIAHLPQMRADLVEMCNFASAARMPLPADTHAVSPTAKARHAAVPSTSELTLLSKESEVYDLFRASPAYPSIRLFLEITVGIQVPWVGDVNPMVTNMTDGGDLVRVRSQARAVSSRVDVSITELTKVLKQVASRRYPALHRSTTRDSAAASDLCTEDQLHALLDDMIARSRPKRLRLR